MKCAKCGTDCENRLYCPRCGWSPKPGMENCLARERNLRASGQLYCPRCLSTRISQGRNYLYLRRDPIRSWLRFLLEIVRTVQFMRLKDQIRYTCQDCENTWYADP